MLVSCFTRVVDLAYVNAPSTVTPSLLKKLADVQPDDNKVLMQWCEEYHVDITSDTLDWTT